MKRFKRILFLVDFDADESPALGRAEELAKANGAAIELLTVIEPLSGAFRSLLPNGGGEFETQARTDALERLERHAAALREQNISVSTSVVTGSPAIETIREVLRHGVDLIVKDADSDRDAAISGPDMRLLRKCPCPVWLIPRDSEPGLKCVLAAVDTAYRDDVEEELSRDILRLAKSIADREGAAIHVVHAWTQPGASYMAKRMTLDEFDGFVNDARERNRERFDALLREFDMEVADSSVHLDGGEPEVVIPACAVKYKADLVVMGTIARAGLSGLLMGNTAERVLRNIRCGILAVKPKSFVSPVSLD